MAKVDPDPTAPIIRTPDQRIAEGEDISGLEDEYRLAGHRPRLVYIKDPASQREDRLGEMIKQFQADDLASYQRFGSIDELIGFVERDLALLLSERFEAATPGPPPRHPMQRRRSR